MTNTAEGPPLQSLTHRLAECPSDFLADPRSRVDAAAVAAGAGAAAFGGAAGRAAVVVSTATSSFSIGNGFFTSFRNASAKIPVCRTVA